MPLVCRFAGLCRDQSDLSCHYAKLTDHGWQPFPAWSSCGRIRKYRGKDILPATRSGSDIGDQGGVGFRYFEEILGGTESGCFDGAGDIEHGEALGDDNGVEVDVAVAEALLDVEHVCRLFEKIFASFEGASW